jgi:hypothetical protein
MKYGHVTEPVPDIEKNQTNKSRARMVILIRRGQTPHDTATFLDLDSFLFNAPYKFGTIERKLQQFVPQPVPEIVIRAWNEQIALKKAYIEPNFIYRNSEVETLLQKTHPLFQLQGCNSRSILQGCNNKRQRCLLMVTTKSRWTRIQSKPLCSKQHQVSGLEFIPTWILCY